MVLDVVCLFLKLLEVAMRSLMLVLFMTACAWGQPVEYPLDLQKIGLTLPKTRDANLAYWFASDRTVFYKLPSAYQQYIPASVVTTENAATGHKSQALIQRKWGIYKSTFQSDFNGNLLFPWDAPAGLNESRKTGIVYETINFMHVPEDESILVINDYPMRWVFPAGQTFGEVIYTKYEGRNYILEIRSRTKSDDCKEWEPRIFRPIGSKAELIKEALDAGIDIGDYKEAEEFAILRNPQKHEVERIEGNVRRLPPLPASVVKQLLAKEFKDVSEHNWSPSADEGFHILPVKYRLDALGKISADNCARCHQQTGTSVNNLIPEEPLIVNNQDKVANIRGYDGIFTWYPFSQDSILENDSRPMPTVKLRQYDVDNRLVLMVDKNQLNAVSGYRLTEFVQRGLKPYELPPTRFLHQEEVAEK